MVDSTPKKYILEDNHEKIELKRLVDPLRESTITRKSLAWLRNTL
jgi:hypothetical protein